MRRKALALLIGLALVFGLAAALPPTASASDGAVVVVNGQTFYQHHLAYVLQGHGLLIGKTVGPAAQTNGYKASIDGFHQSGSRYVPVVDVNNPTAPSPTAPAPLNCSLWNPLCWNWWGGGYNCFPQNVDCGMFSGGLAPMPSEAVMHKIHECWTGAVNGVIATLTGNILARLFVSGKVAMMASGPDGWAYLVIGGCTANMAWVH
jgi:hypothetical protein